MCGAAWKIDRELNFYILDVILNTNNCVSGSNGDFQPEALNSFQ